MKKILFFLSIPVLFASCEDPLEHPKYAFTRKILDGYFVTAMAFDNQGNAWVGTFKQGLIKYNMKTRQSIVYNSSNSILSDNYVIYDIALDSKNNVWIGCDGLVKYDGNTFNLYNSSNTAIPEDVVSTIGIDSKDNVWFAASRFKKGGLVKYDGIGWKVFTPNNSVLPANLIKGIAVDKDDTIWLTAPDGLNSPNIVKISNENWTVYKGADLGFTPYHPTNIDVNSKNELCVTVDYSLSGMWKNGGPQVFTFDGVSSKQLLYDSISDVKFLTVDNKDNIWTANAAGGYAVYDGETWTVDAVTFKDVSIFSIEQALDNKIWIGTGNGIYISE